MLLSDFIKTKAVWKYHWREFVITILWLIDSLVVSFKGKSKDQVRVHQRTGDRNGLGSLDQGPRTQSFSAISPSPQESSLPSSFLHLTNEHPYVESAWEM